MARIKHFLWYWFPALLWAAMIFWFSHQPTLPGPKDYWVNFAVKKPLHVLEFGIFAWLLFRGRLSTSSLGVGQFLGNQISRGSISQSLRFAAIVAMLYAASDEIHQIFVPGREATVRDFLFDVVGILSALWWLRGKFNRDLAP